MTQNRQNPLLAAWTTPRETPPFDKIRLEDYEPAFEEAIGEVRREIDALTANPDAPTFENTIVKLERNGELLGRIEGLFFNLLEADTSDEMQAIAERVQPKLVQLSNDISLNPALFERIRKVHEGAEDLDRADRKLLDDTYQGYVRSGAALPDAKKAEYRALSEQLATLSLKYSQNVLSATNAYTLNITDPKIVEELPAFLRESMAEDARQHGHEGWTVTLQAPSFTSFLRYSSNRLLKEQVWRAYGSRALGGKFDNTAYVRQMVSLRLEIARLLGYDCYADYVLEHRMAENTPTVMNFLEELLEPTIDYARKDYAMVAEYAHTHGLRGEVMPWDFAYYANKYQEEKYALSDELTKPYFKLEHVTRGVFLLAEKLYGLQFTYAPQITTYHPDVKAYEVTDDKGKFMAVLYLDFFPRASKRGGAWMTEFRGAKIVRGEETRPLVSLVMNFTKPTESTPSLLTFDEVETFLHEFGHSLHSILGEGKYESQTGTNVYRDFVELPSQLMENWATEKEFLDLWAVHYQTGEKIPAEIIDRILKAKNYLAAYYHIRQLTFGLLDMAWHTIREPFAGSVEEFERKATAPTRIMPPTTGTAISTGFSHIFAGGYAAGYYGYKWAEVLEADAFSLFKEKGIFNREVSTRLRRELLSKGSTDHPMNLYVNFRGHKPATKALIDKMGLDK